MNGQRTTSGASGRPVPTLTEVLQVESRVIDVDVTVLNGALEKTDAQAVSLIESLSAVRMVASPELDLNLDDPAPVMLADGSLREASAVGVSEPAGDGGRQITERVLGEVQRNIDLMLEYRLRETLTPALARMTDSFIRDTRNELASTLREIVARAVELELARMRRE
ncbi:hypothetical protein BH09PSE5_BH09PSE5_47850 [soil metagenome]